MSEVETAIAAAAGILGVAVGYLLQERQVKKQIRLRPLEDRQNALKETYGALVDCYYSLSDAANDTALTRDKFDKTVGEAQSKLESVLRKNGIWLSKIQWPIIEFRVAFLATRLAIQLRMEPPTQPVTQSSWGDLLDTFATASKAIAKELGIPVLEEDLRNIIRSTAQKGKGPTESKSPSPSRNTKSTLRSLLAGRNAKYVILSLANLAVLYLSSLLITNPYWLSIDIGFFGGGLLIGLLILFKRRLWIKPFVTALAWLGVTLGGIVNGVFQRITLAIAPLVALDWRLILLLLVLVVNNALLLSLLDYTRDVGKSFKTVSG